MNITLNGLNNPSNLVCIDGVPNILKVTDPIVGSYATFTFEFTSTMLMNTVTADTQYYISFLGESVTNVMEPSNAKNKRFFISTTQATAASLCQALRNCASISAQFDIVNKGAQVQLRSKTIGMVWSNYPNFYQTNIPTQYMTASGTDGTSTNDSIGGRIIVDIYENDDNNIASYWTTLEKNSYDGETSFDLSPVLSTISQYGSLEPWRADISLIKANGSLIDVGYVTASTIVGYTANQSDRYLYNTSAKILLNATRGEEGTKLYVYNPSISLSVMCPENIGGITITAKLYDSVGRLLSTYSDTRRNTNSKIIDVPSIAFSTQYWSQTAWVDISMGSDEIRFYVIKPLKATEYYQRVYWRNCYGGIQFFDFTAKRSEQDSVDIETYEKNVFDYYDSESYERKMIYSNDYSKEVTLTSHLIEKDGTYVFNDLMRSKRVWTEVNGKTYYIIPKSIEVTENDTYNNIYQVSFKYEYSDI